MESLHFQKTKPSQSVVCLLVSILWFLGLPHILLAQDQDKHVVSAAFHLATFDIDATPPIGSMLAYDTMTARWDLGLRARGIVLLGEMEEMYNNPQSGKEWLAQHATKLAWMTSYKAGKKTSLSCLKINDIRILHLPAEMFIEYQLAAKKMRPDLFVAVAAYGDYGLGYVGTAIAYSQGGYEVQVSPFTPEAEPILLKAIGTLLGVSR